MSINHFTATGIVFNSKKQVLMIFHNKLQVWLPPGGHIEENELPDDAVLREIYEETGIKAEILSNRQELVLSDNDCKGLKRPFTVLLENIEGDWSHNHIDMVYICTAKSEELTMQKSEASDIGWFSIPQIIELKTYENVRQTIMKATNYLFSYENNLKRQTKISPRKLSGYLSQTLRHHPEFIQLNMDENGWINIDELIAKTTKYRLTIEVIKDIVKNNDKQRFKISDDGKMIRASQGHSIEIDLGLESKTPPAILYHGTVKRFLSSIMNQGLLSRGRNYVHLSHNEKTAVDVGKRRGEPIILKINSGKMHEDGIKFYLSDNNVWLVDSVPVEYINCDL
ncbi:MAG: RNA 2'-phosphotransferase [Treponema sp.]|nr:RNA 2'-phosphotransferase [Treponema sp.]